MSAGMAGIITGVLAKHRNYVRNEDFGGVICGECGWEVSPKWPEASAADSTTDRMNQHESHIVAAELTKAGFGLVPDVAPEYGARTMLVNGLSAEPHPHGPAPHPSWFSKSTHVRLVGPWQELKALPDPLAAAMNDQEGRALVQAIHDRKTER